MINPFATDAELEALQAYADRERWRLECQALGAASEAIELYERQAWQYAITTPHPNSAVMDTARRALREALARGESIPEDAAQFIRRQMMRDLAQALGLL